MNPPQNVQAMEMNDDIRAPDPNVIQRRASDPSHSVWVSASAGTGKTKVLVDRVLRLLLPRSDGTPGTPPHKIICLTFTKAGASEMSVRINKVLSDWAILSDDDLEESLNQLCGQPPNSTVQQSARQLFAKVVDVPGGLKITTIHSFCQSLLGRFPLEAELSPNFKALDDQEANTLLERAFEMVLSHSHKDESLKQAIRRVSLQLGESAFKKHVHNLIGERLQLRDATEGDIRTKICRTLNIDPNETINDVVQEACRNFDESGLRRACTILSSGSKRDQDHGLTLQNWLDLNVEQRIDTFTDYQSVYITQKETINKNLITKKLAEVNPECLQTLHIEAERLLNIRDQLRAMRCAELSVDLLLIGRHIYRQYSDLKSRQSGLDYDDLILKTRDLLRKPDTAPWVLYKLDGGIDHILVDEAQDTNPEQWDIIESLAQEFFSGASAREDIERTLFVVGDLKQSIYSFQRASPDLFHIMRDRFDTMVKTAGKLWREETINISFRSSKAVLNVVDEVFRPDDVRQGLEDNPFTHYVSDKRRGQAGHVELWPLESADEIEKDQESWPLPITPVTANSGSIKLAGRIAGQIRTWLDDEHMLESKNRAIQPGDILILVRTRTVFVNQLIRSLKKLNIPVSGVDRMKLGQQIAVKDLLALARFALHPYDDLTLATILKSPLIGWNEDRLYDLAIDRKGTLWDCLKRGSYNIETQWLSMLIEKISLAPYDFFSDILYKSCPADEKSGLRAILQRLGEDALDPLNEFLNEALLFAGKNTASLHDFIFQQQQSETEITREMDEAAGHVRIMTVHGSKGLQAPIVFLPDTTRVAQSKRLERLLWPDKSGLSMPLWAADKDSECRIFQQTSSLLEQKMDEEYRRLLYVAMTRAEDRLYICGSRGATEPIADSWYNHIFRAFDVLCDDDKKADGLRVYSNPQTRDAQNDEHNCTTEFNQKPIMPEWLFCLPDAEPSPPSPLVPSRPSEPDPAVISPSVANDTKRFLRGNITHKLLELLPPLPEKYRENAAICFTESEGQVLSKDVRNNIVIETLAVLNHPDYAPLFGPNSMAEVPISGLIGNKLISGQIDRLYDDGETIWIIDYKTNRPAPREEKDIPDIYRAQMRSYYDVLKAIYPDKDIRCALLWTDGPHFMELQVGS